MIKVRHARLEDAAGISRVHRSHVKGWSRVLGDKEFPVRYGSLSIGERWGFGGPWMSPETCVVRLNEMILKGHVSYVAVKGNAVVGHMELFIGREGDTYGKNAHIPVLYVHENYQGRGIGSELVNKAFGVATRSGCDTLTAASSPDNACFYSKNGIQGKAGLIEISVPVTKNEAYAHPENVIPYPIAYGSEMAVGRYQSAACHMFEASVRYAVEGQTGSARTYYERYVEGYRSLFLLDEGERNIVYAWTKGAHICSMIDKALTLASARCMKTADMLLSSEDYEPIKGKYDERVKGSRSMLVHDFRCR